MPIYVATFSFRDPTRDYAPLFDVLDRAKAVRALDTTWLIDVHQEIEDLTVQLRSLMGADDRLLVMTMGAQSPWSATNMDKESKAWLTGRMEAHALPRSGSDEAAKPRRGLQ